MSFSQLIKIKNQDKKQYSHINPTNKIRNLIKKKTTQPLKENNQNNLNIIATQTSIKKSKNENNLTFSSLSKDKNKNYHSNKNLFGKYQSKQKQFKIKDVNNRNVCRQLNYDGVDGKSSNELSFSNIIKKSKEKSLKKKYFSDKEIIKKSPKANKPKIDKSFNKMRNKLMGIEDQPQKNCYKIMKELDAVQTSTNFEKAILPVQEYGQLDMLPTL